MKLMPVDPHRYVLLEHFGAPDDPRGCHLDLLLEDGDSCRSWRLDAIPLLNGPGQNATPLPPHRLVWLDREAAAVSGGRGWARRVVGGRYRGNLPASADQPLTLELEGMAAIGMPDPVCLSMIGELCCLSQPRDQQTERNA